jgi:hypothetical protein
MPCHKQLTHLSHTDSFADFLSPLHGRPGAIPCGVEELSDGAASRRRDSPIGHLLFGSAIADARLGSVRAASGAGRGS